MKERASGQSAILSRVASVIAGTIQQNGLIADITQSWHFSQSLDEENGRGNEMEGGTRASLLYVRSTYLYTSNLKAVI